MLSGTGIGYGFNDGSDPAIGFFTTRTVRAGDLQQAHERAKMLVLSEWQPGGDYAEDNRGALPDLVVDESWAIGFFSGVLGRKGGGYAFFTQE